MSKNPSLLEDFGGTARLFPLPNLVLFPNVAQPLHIFEPRYRQMLTDALDDDRLLAMALLCPGWEQDYHKTPPIHPMLCLGRITQEERLGDGRFNLVLRGLHRARIREELKTTKLYRVARVELCADVPVGTTAQEQALRQELARGVTPFFSQHPQALEQLRRLLESPLPLGSLCDIFCFALPLDVQVKQQLLDTVAVETRVRWLLGDLAGRSPPVADGGPRKRFPPEFSAN